MKRLVIAIDCDDVLVQTTPWFVDKYNQIYGTNVALADAHTNSDDIWQATHSEMLNRFSEMLQADDYRRLGPSQEEISILEYLASRHELHLVTARQESERMATEAMIERDIPGIFTSLQFVGWQGSKGDICHKIGADVLVDDNARHLHDAIGRGLPVGGGLLYGAYPWNSGDASHKDLLPCSTWFDVKNAIDAIADGVVHAEPQ